MFALVSCAGPGRHAERPPVVDPHPGFLRDYAETYRFSAGRPAGIKITPDGDAVLFLRSGPRSRVREQQDARRTGRLHRGRTENGPRPRAECLRQVPRAGHHALNALKSPNVGTAIGVQFTYLSSENLA